MNLTDHLGNFTKQAVPGRNALNGSNGVPSSASDAGIFALCGETSAGPRFFEWFRAAWKHIQFATRILPF